jgi:multimeric flavodoxin WrbA
MPEKESEMKVLGIYGSPRAGGNSDRLLDEALRGAEEAGAEVSRVYAREAAVHGCRECGGCDRTGRCVQRDRMDEIYPLLAEAQAIILSTPIFFYAMPAQVKALVDRTQAMWSDRALRKPKQEWNNHGSGKGYLIGVGATRGKNLFEGVELTAKYFYDAMDMDYAGGIFFRLVEGKDDAAGRPEVLTEAYELGKKAAGK